ncbi:helix-turn-helix domain-containing protein [Streptomyces sp. NBC_00365]|uniref:helix-turn-helix domain-containing protein n=1 Tax=Streptomyces sp. NBC_00365 TaxID=2975726 RepID=UPI002B1CFB46|nr:helix-turn-helix domain-containing protein [Streptomyces sp. NBC_00365]
MFPLVAGGARSYDHRMQLRYAFRVYPEPGQRLTLAGAFGCAVPEADHPGQADTRAVLAGRGLRGRPPAVPAASQGAHARPAWGTEPVSRGVPSDTPYGSPERADPRPPPMQWTRDRAPGRLSRPQRVDLR